MVIFTFSRGSSRRGNYSRIGIARVKFNEAGDPVRRRTARHRARAGGGLRTAADGGGGCEDPRITFVEPLQRYVMTYTALSPNGPRIALAISEDLFHWKRLGLATFAPYNGIDFVHVDNKDASLFPVAIPNHAGKTATGLPPSPAFSRHPSRGNRPPSRVPCWWTSITKASGFPIVPWPWRASNRRTSACLIRITGSRLRWRPGSGSRSAAALRRS